MSKDYFRGLLTQDLELANVTLTTIPIQIFVIFMLGQNCLMHVQIVEA